MNKENYQKYLHSVGWLLKKWELISVYKELKWNIDCIFCNSINNLQVHHFSYDNIGNEIRKNGKDKGIDIYFSCKECHKKYHFDKDFKENWLKSIIQF